MLFLKTTPKLTNQQIEIYKYIELHPDRVIYMRIRDLAREVGVSTTSIIRFCNKFGCEGFTEFKIRLQLFLKGNLQNKYQISNQSSYINFFQNINNVSFNSKIKDAVRILSAKSLLFIYGFKQSSAIVPYAIEIFQNFRPSILLDESNKNFFSEFSADHTNDYAVILLIEDDDEKIIEYINQIVTKGISVIAINNLSNTHGMEFATVSIPFYFSYNKIGDKKVVSQVPIVYLIELLVAECVKNS
jgi:DNA-binding MurR/RpiR family transcriptional regulator